MKQNNSSILSLAAVENNLFCLLLIFLLSVLLMLKQLVTPGYFSVIGNDAYAYTSWAWQLVEALKEGIIYPRWMSLDMWGYGSPTFIIYPPLSYYMVALFSLFTKSITLAMNMCIFVSLFVSGIGIFFLVRELFDNKVALFSALFYLLLPYNVLEFYLLSSFASKISFMWFSPVLFFTYRYIKRRQAKYLVFAILCYSALILTHIINAYMFTFVLIAFIVFLTLRYKSLKDGFKMLTIVPLSILISAAYLLPLIIEKHLVNMNSFFQEGSGYFYSAYFMLAESSTNQFPYFASSAYYIIFLLHAGLFAVLMAWLHYIMLKTKYLQIYKSRKLFYYIMIFTALFSYFLLFSPSTILWETLPFIKYIHFPFRWLIVANYTLGLLFAYIFGVLIDAATTNKFILSSVILLLLLFVIMDSHYIIRSSIFKESELIPITAVHSSKDHKLPWVDINKLDKMSGYEKKLDIAEGQGRAQAVVWKSAERVIDAQAAQPMVLRIRTFNFPGWKAYLDGRGIDIRTEDKTGVILVDVPKGSHRIKLIFGDTPVRFYGKVISLLSIISLLMVVLLYELRKRSITLRLLSKNSSVH